MLEVVEHEQALRPPSASVRISATVGCQSPGRRAPGQRRAAPAPGRRSRRAVTKTPHRRSRATTTPARWIASDVFPCQAGPVNVNNRMSSRSRSSRQVSSWASRPISAWRSEATGGEPTVRSGGNHAPGPGRSPESGARVGQVFEQMVTKIKQHGVGGYGVGDKIAGGPGDQDLAAVRARTDARSPMDIESGVAGGVPRGSPV